MLYDPQGAGALPDNPLVRRGKAWESRSRLASQAAQAEAAGFGHGVSVTSPDANDVLALDPADSVQASRRAFEDSGFEVHHTPTGKDSDHHTVVLPKPVTDEAAERFNTVLGRTKAKR
jgi:hypothetical protein